MLDVKRLIGEVAAQNGIRLEPDDPAFALVTLNQLVLEETASRLNEHVSSLLIQFTDSISKVERRAGAMLAQDVRNALAEVRKEITAGYQDANLTASREGIRPLSHKWMAIGILSGTLLFSIGIAVGCLLVVR